MKFANLKKGKRAIKRIQFRLGNAPIPTELKPSDAMPTDEWTVACGVITLEPEKIAEVYEKAGAKAREKGVKEWLDDHPICRLYEHAYTVLFGCVDIESEDGREPFFASIDDILNAPELGMDNMVYLWEQQGIWQDECSLKTAGMTFDEIIAAVYVSAELEEHQESPLARMRPSMRETFLRTTAKVLAISVAERSLSTSINSSSSTN
jgi:hypothetical protein